MAENPYVWIYKRLCIKKWVHTVEASPDDINILYTLYWDYKNGLLPLLGVFLK